GQQAGPAAEVEKLAGFMVVEHAHDGVVHRTVREPLDERQVVEQRPGIEEPPPGAGRVVCGRIRHRRRALTRGLTGGRSTRRHAVFSKVHSRRRSPPSLPARRSRRGNLTRPELPSEFPIFLWHGECSSDRSEASPWAIHRTLHRGTLTYWPSSSTSSRPSGPPVARWSTPSKPT